MKLFDVVPHIMRPPGGGIPAFSAGKGSAQEFQRQYYSLKSHQDILIYWKETWKKAQQAKVWVLGAPLDTGAGIRRGAMYGPRAIRTALTHSDLLSGQWSRWLEEGTVFDLGDLWVNPHLLHDEMLADHQIRKCQDEMYADAPLPLRHQLPVSALSQAEFLIRIILDEFPHARLLLLGGDHSLGWPMTAALHRQHPSTLGIVQPDAHTDLLPSRLGVKYCFGTWSFHASQLLGNDGRLVQLGIRQTGRDRGHWESATGVKQFWANEISQRPTAEVLAEMVAHLKAKGVKQVYFSNDIDGTDQVYASATGTPAPDGMHPDFVVQVIRTLGREFELVAADLVEVAPDLAKDENERLTTLQLAARYAFESVKALLKQA